MEIRYSNLFSAARVLLADGGIGKDQVIPTLALHNLIDELEASVHDEADDWGRHPLAPSLAWRLLEAEHDRRAWERAEDEFVGLYGSLRPARVAGGVLVLERLPVYVSVELDSDEGHPEVLISVYGHGRLARPEHVALNYEKELVRAGVPCGESCMGGMSFSLDGGLHMRITNGRRTYVTKNASGHGYKIRTEPAQFPHPQVVQGFYGGLLGMLADPGLREQLPLRRRGPRPSVLNLVPACVAFYLQKDRARQGGARRSRAEVHRILNEHVLCAAGRTLPDDAVGGSATNRLWRDVKNTSKVRDPLFAAGRTLFLDGDE